MMMTTATIRLEYLGGHTSRGPCWFGADDRTEEMLSRAEAQTGLTRDAILIALANGQEIQTGSGWNSRIRCADVAEARRVARQAQIDATPAPRFTCRRCGEHRDTTVPGHCDDCEA